jgi:hypothetical protein
VTAIVEAWQVGKEAAPDCGLKDVIIEMNDASTITMATMYLKFRVTTISP